MHIPDGFVNVGTAAVALAGTAGAVAYSVKKAQSALGERQVPLMGVMGAFIFAAQMINFPVAGGTSGHLLGGALAAILLGPWAGTLVITAVLMIQALVFQDGGILALGANALNMAVIGVWSAHLVYQLLRRILNGSRSQWISGFVAAWISVMLAALAASIELAISGMSSLSFLLPAMLGVHALIGIGEGLITAAVLGFVASTRGDLLKLAKEGAE